MKVFRCQLPHSNPFYSSEAPKCDGTDKPSGPGGSFYLSFLALIFDYASLAAGQVQYLAKICFSIILHPSHIWSLVFYMELMELKCRNLWMLNNNWKMLCETHLTWDSHIQS